MKSFFITSSGTGIGKTLVTASLCWQLHQGGRNPYALKPVISGWDSKDNDVIQILKSLKLPITQENIEKISLYRFSAPLSPDMAAEKEGLEINFDKLVKFSLEKRNCDYLFIEGIGGVMTPLSKDKTVIDLITALQIPTILVAGSYLGSLSHALTAIDVIKTRKIKLLAVIINESDDSSVPFDATLNTMQNFTKETIIALPRIAIQDKDNTEIWKLAADLKKVLKDD